MSKEKKHKDMWNWYCYRCKCKGVAQELVMNFDDDGGDWLCPNCKTDDIEDVGWREYE